MPIITPKVDTTVEKFDYASPADQQRAALAQLMAGKGADAAQAAQEAQAKQRLQKQQQAGEVEVHNKKTASDTEALKKLMDSGALNDGGSAKVGDVSAGADPYAHQRAMGPMQGKNFAAMVGKEYTPINTQLDASRATIDALNQGNSASDKLALINEAKLAAGTGGSRAIKSIMDSLTGGKTVGMDFQGAMNYIQNTPNIPTMQPAQRDAIRESVYGRLPQLEQQHAQAQQRLQALGPSVAPMTDTGSIIGAYATPAQQNLSQLKQGYSEYQKQRQGAPNAISTPSTASPNPTTLDRLKGLFGMGQSPAQQAPTGQPQQDPSYTRYQQLLQKQQAGGQ